MRVALNVRPSPLTVGQRPKISLSNSRSLVVRKAMVESQDLVLGEVAPNFSLPDVNNGNKATTLSDIAAGKQVVVVTISSPHCPFVIHIGPQFGKISAEFKDKVGFVGISSNDITAKAADGPEGMRKFAETHGWNFPFLFDESQDVAKAYKAMCTPEFYVFRKDAQGTLRLAYHGQFDSSRPTKYHERLNTTDGTATGADLRKAIEAALRGEDIPQPWRHSIGCNVKWKSGNNPSYYQG